MKTDFCVSLPSSCPGVLSVVRWSSVTARWSYVVCLWSLSTIRRVMVWVAPLAVANEAVDCGSVGSSTARWSHVASGQYRGVSSLTTLLWESSCHGGMGNLFWWSLPLVQLLQNFPPCFVNFVLLVVFDIYVLFMCCMSVCFSYVYTCPRCLYE